MSACPATRLPAFAIAAIAAIFGLASSSASAQSPGWVIGQQKISDTAGGFDGVLIDGGFFGSATAGPGDLDGDGVEDLVVGAMRDPDGPGFFLGAVWFLYLNTDGTVKSHAKISDSEGGFSGVLQSGDQFGSSIAILDDLDGDGVNDLAVGAFADDDGASNPPDPTANLGAVYILFLNADETVKSYHKISAAPGGGLEGLLDDADTLGFALVQVGDLDNDGVSELAVGAIRDDDGAFDPKDPDANLGAVYILFLNADGSVATHKKISATTGGFTGALDDGDGFGRSLTPLGDVDGDGIEDLAVGAVSDDDGGTDRGAVWILYLNADGTVKSHTKISDTEGGFTGALDDGDNFGYSVVGMGDLDGDGIGDLAVSADRDDDGGEDRGAVWILFLNADETVKAHQKISDLEGGFGGTLDDVDRLGAYSMAAVGDLNGDGITDLAPAAHGDDDGGTNRGAVWILFLDGVPPPPGHVLGHQKISDTQGGFDGVLNNKDFFGEALAAAGDLDGDGIEDLLVGSVRDDDGGTDRGAVWVLYLNPGGSVKSHAKISAAPGEYMEGLLENRDRFGGAVAALGDIDGDGVNDLAVSAHGDDDGASDPNDPNSFVGAVYVLFLNADESVKSHHKISAAAMGDMENLLSDFDGFGASLAHVGDLDNDGLVELAVGTTFDDDGASDPKNPDANLGAVYILFLNTDGSVRTHQKISATMGGFTGALEDGDAFGRSIAPLGDVDGDGIEDLAVSAVWDDDGGADQNANRGAVYILYLNADGTVKSHTKISDTEGDFTGILDDGDHFGYSVASMGDLDVDGIGDLAVSAERDDDGGMPPDADRGAVWILFLNADETVKSHQKISDLEGGFDGLIENGDRLGYAVAALADLNGDGFADLASSAHGDDDGGVPPIADRGAVWLLSLSGFAPINFDDPQEFVADGEPIIDAVGDLDGDGDEDVVVVIPDIDPGLPGDVQVFLNNGTLGGIWQGFTANPVIPVGLDPSGVALGFFDGDAFLDMAVTNAGDDDVLVFLNDGMGTGTFDPAVSFPVGNEPRAVAAGLLDGADVDEDLAVANAADGTVFVLGGDGLGGFGAPQVIAAAGGPCALDPEDMDDDKDTDLVIARCTDQSVLVWFQGTGPAPGTVSIPVASSPVDLSVADIDGNGSMDIVSANIGGTVGVILNQGAGVFDAAVEVPVGADPRSVEAVDLDGDGDPDVAVVADDPVIGPAVQVLANESGGEGVDFGPPQAFGVDADPNFVAAADLNGDGAADLVTANADETKGGTVTALLYAPPFPECPGDIDGDGETGFQDLLALLAAWSPDMGSCVGCPEDVDEDGDVDFQDLLQMLGAWGGCP